MTLRGNHRQDIFFAPDDRVLFNTIVADIVPHFGARLHAYCWMTNHIHMLLQVGEMPLGRIMLRIASQYARTLQARFHTTGHLFERRYHAVLVDADTYLLELLRYIHLNPVRAAMVPSPADYLWSSHHAYTGQRSVGEHRRVAGSRVFLGKSPRYSRINALRKAVVYFTNAYRFFPSDAARMRKPRLHIPAAFYHVTLRGNHRQDIFFAPDDRVLFNTIVADIVPHFGARLHAYCWMTNHIHMLLQVGEMPLGRIMLRIASQYARALQARFHTTGHLFERRYHAVLVDADTYLLELLRYIHLNPVRAAMVPSPTDYLWSSHHAYTGQRSEAWVTTEFALGLLHHELPLARLSYQRFLQVTPQATSPLEHCNPNDRRILGSDDFASKLLGAAWQPRTLKTLDQLLDEACQQWPVTRDTLRSPSRHRQLTYARAWIAHQAVTQRIASLSHIARSLNRSEASLRESVKLHFNYP